MTSPEWEEASEDDSDRQRSTFDRADNTARLALELAEAKREIARLKVEYARASKSRDEYLDLHLEGSDALIETIERVETHEAEIARLHRDAWGEAQAYRAIFARAQEAEGERDHLRAQLQTECNHAAMSWTGSGNDWRCDNCGKVGTESELNGVKP